MINGNRPTLALIGIQHRFRGFAAMQRRQLVGQIDGVMQTAVHTHAADGIVQMGRITRKEHPTQPVLCRDALMHVVDGAMFSVIATVFFPDTLQACLGLGVGQHFRIRLFGRGRKQTTPAAYHFQQHTPLIGVGDVVDIAQAVQHLAEIKSGGRNIEPLGKGQPGEIDIGGTPDIAA